MPSQDGTSGQGAQVRGPLLKKVTLADLHDARTAGRALAMLTCYDYTTATLLQQAGVPLLLVGDSAANVILGHDATTGIDQAILQTLATAVRRGAPNAFVMADMPFGSYHGEVGRAVENVCEMVRVTGCDAVKLEVVDRQAKLVQRISDAGVAVCAHLGLRPQSVQRYGYRAQGRTAEGAKRIVNSARRFERAGAAMILLEAVPAEVGRAVAEAVEIPVIGCGAGPAPMAHVVVLQDLLGQTARQPKFVPVLPPLPVQQAAEAYVRLIDTGEYPAAMHCYKMREGESV